jgi:hypothetical protein
MLHFARTSWRSRIAGLEELHVTLDDRLPTSTLTLGPFRVGAAGALEPMADDRAPGFTCRWRQRTVYARLLPGEPVGWRLVLRAPLGRVPSSVRPDEAARRSSSFGLLRALPATLPEGWRVGLAADHRVLLEAERHASLPITATALVSEITTFLLTLAPYLDVLEETGLTVPADPVGARAGERHGEGHGDRPGGRHGDLGGTVKT